MGTERMARAEVETLAVATLFVMVAHYIRHPVEEHLHGCLAFGMLAHQPVAVTVGPIVVGTAAWPRFAELTAIQVGHIVVAMGGVHPVGKAVDTVRIQARNHLDDGVLQQFQDGFIFRSRKEISSGQGRIHGRSLVAMDGVREVHHYRHAVDVGLCRDGCIGQLHVFLLDLLQFLQVFGRGDGHLDDGTVLVSLAHHFHFHSVRVLLYGFNVSQHIVPVGILFAHLEAQDVLGLGNVGTELVTYLGSLSCCMQYLREKVADIVIQILLYRCVRSCRLSPYVAGWHQRCSGYHGHGQCPRQDVCGVFFHY